MSVMWAGEISRVSVKRACRGVLFNLSRRRRSLLSREVTKRTRASRSHQRSWLFDENRCAPPRSTPLRATVTAMGHPTLSKQETHRIFANERLHALQVRYPWFCGYAAAPFAFAAG